MVKKTDGDVMAEDKESVETLKDFIINHVNHFYVNHIPFDSIKDMSSTYLYFFGTVAYIFSFTMFAYFFYQNYQSSLQQAFISLEEDAGNCNTVPIVIQGEYIADTKGQWSTNPGFIEVKAQYTLRLAGFEISTDSQYNAMMDFFYEKLQRVGEQAISNNLAENVLVWMTFIQYYSLDYSVTDDTYSNISSIGQVQAFTMYSDPSSVFNLNHFTGRIGSSHGICPLSSYATFDAANHVMSTSWYNYTQFRDNPICAEAVYAKNFGYYAALDDNIFSISLDVDSFAIATAINLNYIPMSFLTVISTFVVPFHYRGVTYTIGEYFDLRYSSMKSLYCIWNVTAIPTNDEDRYLPQQLCFIPYGATFTLPTFNPFGSSYTSPEACVCDESRSGHSDACNTFNFLLGLVLYRNGNTDLNVVQTLRGLVSGSISPKDVNVTNILVEFGLFSLVDNVALYPSYAAYNRAAYTSSYYTAYVGDSGNGSSPATPHDVAVSYESFCQLTDGTTCSMIAFNVFDETAHTVSPYKYQLRNGSCHNSMVVSATAWASLVSTPPVQFTEQYFECYDNTQAAIVASIGIAQGNTQTFLPFFVVLALPLLYLVLVMIREVPPKEEYKEQEKDEVNAILALLMLRLRDGKTRGMKKNGVLMQLAREMIAMAKEEGGYPDSDDEDDEEEEEEDEEGEGEGADGEERQQRQSKRQSKRKGAPKGRTVRVDSDDEYSQRGTFAGGISSQHPSLIGSVQDDDDYDDHHGGGHGGHGRRSRKTPKTLILQGNRVIVEDTRSQPRGGVVDQFRQLVAQRNKRKRMDVFTKHLSATQQQQGPSAKGNKHLSFASNTAAARSPGGGSGGGRGGRPTDVGGGGELDDHDESRFSASGSYRASRFSSVATTVFRRITTNTGFRGSMSTNQAPPPASTSLWSSLFGGSSGGGTEAAGAAKATQKQQEMQERPSLVAKGGTAATTASSGKSSKSTKGTGSGAGSGAAGGAGAAAAAGAVDSSVKAKSITAYLDLTLYAPPQHVQILNVTLAFQANPMANAGSAMSSSASSSARGKKELSPDEMMLLLNDLVRYLGEALSAPVRPAGASAATTSATVAAAQNPLHATDDEPPSNEILELGNTRYRLDSVEPDVYHEITRRDHIAFQQQALPLSARLANQGNWQRVLEELDETDRAAIALKLINILSMHASIEYDCPMSEVSTLYGKKIAYNIGQRLVTLYLLERLVR